MELGRTRSAKSEGNLLLLGLITGRRRQSELHACAGIQGVGATSSRHGTASSGHKHRQYQTCIKSIPLIRMSSSSLCLRPPSHYNKLGSASNSNHAEFIASTKHSRHKSKLAQFNAQEEPAPTQDSLNDKINDITAAVQHAKKSAYRASVKKYSTILNRYVVDYKVFNYVDKVVEDPHKWAHYVHDRQAVQQQLRLLALRDLNTDRY